MLPALVASMAAVYGVGKSIDSLRYWSDYRKNTGYSPRYPFRSGSLDWMGYSAGAGMAYGNIYSNYANLYRPKKIGYNPMYG